MAAGVLNFFTILLTIVTSVINPVLSEDRPVAQRVSNFQHLPELSATSAFLFEVTTGQVLFEKNADALLPLASLTKLMTALTLAPKIGKEQWERYLTFQGQDQRQGDRAILLPGERVTVKDAWHLMLVSSSNDAAAALVRTFSQDEPTFVQTMQETARNFGLQRLQFADPSGLSAHNVGSAREIAALGRIALTVTPLRFALLQQRYQLVPAGKQPRPIYSTNWLLGSGFGDPQVKILGGKTGYLEESNYHLFLAARRGKQELLGVVLGAPERAASFEDMRALMKWGFSLTNSESAVR